MAQALRFSALLAMATAALAPACSDDPTDSTGAGGGTTSTGTGGTTSTGTGGASTTSSTGGGGSASTTSAGGATGSGGAAEGGAGGQGGGGGPPTIRRPFLVGRAMRSSESATRSDWARTSNARGDALDDATRAMLAKVWRADALEEHASVAAFARWTLLMMSVGAPPEMLRDAQRASIDEVEHARACFALAKRYGGEDVGPAALDLTGCLAPLSLVDVAVLTAEEGCVGETLGVALAHEQLRVCEDAEVKQLLRRLIVDEERHARLAWSFVAWAIVQGGASVRNAVVAGIARACRETLEAPIRSYDGVDLGAWHAHGRVTCTEAREVAREAIDAVIKPALALLSRNATPIEAQS
jgi:hypothetical protein